MATQSVNTDEAVVTPVSIYFGLEKGEKADLETVAQAALAWSSAFRQLVRTVEPGLTVEIRIVDGDDGSLWLNTLLSFIESQLEQIARGSDRYPRLKALARGLAIIVVATPLAVTSENIFNALIEEEPEIGQLSPEAEQQLKDVFERVIEERIAEAERVKFAKVVSSDSRITSVGVAADSLGPPPILVAREKLADYVNRERSENIAEDTRQRVSMLEVLLVSPVLEEAERSWKFREPGMPEFGAVMRDKGFLAAIGRREVHEELRFGIPMTIELEIKERLEGEAWMPAERNVLRVVKPEVDRAELPL